MQARLAVLPALLGLALSSGAAQAQTPGAGRPVTGGPSAPAVHAGTGSANTPTRQARTAPPNTPTMKDDAVSRADRKVIDAAANAGMVEVQVSQLAAAKATDGNVKSFAGMLGDHHTAANNELVKIANARGVELPPAPKRSLRRDIEKLGKKSGEEFDREFVRNVGIKA